MSTSSSRRALLHCSSELRDDVGVAKAAEVWDSFLSLQERGRL